VQSGLSFVSNADCVNQQLNESSLQAFELTDGSPTDQKWHSSKDTKATVDETPRQRDATDLAGDECERNDSGAGYQAKSNDLLVAHWTYEGANERNGHHEMSEGNPIGVVGEQGIECVEEIEIMSRHAVNLSQRIIQAGGVLECLPKCY
jgi:hypothetical protein